MWPSSQIGIEAHQSMMYIGQYRFRRRLLRRLTRFVGPRAARPLTYLIMAIHWLR